MSKGRRHDAQILIMGSTGVGKTKITRQIEQAATDNQTECTIAPDLIWVKYPTGKVEFVDPPGSTQMATLVHQYFRQAHAVIAVFDVTRPSTYSELKEHWFRSVEQWSEHDTVPMLVLANMMDKAKESVAAKMASDLITLADTELHEWAAMTTTTTQHHKLQLVGKVVPCSARTWVFPQKTHPVEDFVAFVLESLSTQRKATVSPGKSERVVLFQPDPQRYQKQKQQEKTDSCECAQ